jgi:acyl transferase domain-containing protein
MDEAPAYLASHDMSGHHNSIPARPCTNHQGSEDHQSARSHLFCFSSIEKLGVKRVMRSYLDYLQSAHASSSDDFLQNLAYTLGCRRSTMEWKGAIVAESTDDLVAKLRSVDESTFKRSSRDSSPPICFVFCGQGSQWAGMGRDLIGFKAFRESLEAASYFMSIYLESRFNLLEELFATEHESRISESEVSQPATTALQVALVDLLAALSIKPKYVVGHSSGEIAAAYASGFITRETAWEVAYHRGAAAASLALKAPTLKGGMLAVGMSLEEATTYMEPISNFVQVACINSPRSVTLSGRAEEISSIANELRGKGVFSKLLPVGTAYHSKHMKLVEHEYGSLLKHIGSSKKRPQATMYSSVTSREVNAEQLGASYWVDNMVSPVNYVGALQEMMKLPSAKRPKIFVEISPRPYLRTPTLDTLTDMDPSLAPNLMSSLERGVHGETSLLQLAGNLWALGHAVDLKYASVRGRQQQAPKCLADLPPYPWNHDKTYWHESHLGEANRFRKYPRQDLIGAPTADSIPFQPRWRGFLRISENPWLQDHQVQKTIIYPAAGMVAMALEAAKQVSDNVSGLLGHEIVNMKIERAMLVPSTSHGLETAFNMNFSSADAGSGNDGLPSNSAEFSIYSKQLGGPWERNASGSLRFRFTDDSWQEIARMHEAEYKTASATCTEFMVPRQLYELLDTVGMNYGSLFQNIVDIRKGRDSCVSKIRIPDTKAKMPARFEYPHVLHPATLDSMFQTLFAIEPSPMVPTFIESLFVSADLADVVQERGECFVGRAAAQRIGVGDAKADITMKLEGTQSHVIVKGLVLTGLASSAPEDGGFLPNHRNLCTEVVWKEDVDFSMSLPGSLLDYIQLWVHKRPGASILQVGGASELALAILDSLSPAKREPFKLSRFTIANLGPSSAEQTLNLVSDRPVAHVVEAVKIDGSEPLADFDLVLVDRSVDYDTGHLEKHLKPHGRMLAVAGDAGAARAEPWGDQNSTSPRDNLHIAILYSHRCTINIRWLMNRLLEISALNEFGGITVVPISDRDMERHPSILSDKIVLSLLDFETDVPGHGFVFEWSKRAFDLFHTVQKTAKGIVWLTRGAQMDCSNARAAPIVGLARTLMSEDPLKTIVTLDLDEGSRVDSREICSMILFVLFKTFSEANKGVAREMEYAARGGKLYIPRLDIVSSLNEIIEGGGRENIAQVAFRAEESSPTTLALTVTKPGLTDGGICFTEFGLPDIGPHDVEIAFDRAILSFPDLENALGRTTQPAIGMDVVGRIVRKGRSVADLEIGAQVMALVPGGAVESSIVTNSCFVAAFQPGTVPSCLISAYYALYRVGRLENGGTALVHAGAGIYGLAALQLCKLAGVEVFLTLEGEDVAGQREILERSGVQSDYIIDASSEGFVDVIMQRTGGKGVDVVYNPTQEHVDLSAACVRRRKLT